MSNQLTIRKAQVADAERMIHVHFNAVHGIPENFYSRTVLLSWSPTPCSSRYEWMRDVVQSPSHLALVAELKLELCAFSICSLTDGFIQAIYVDPKFSGRGIGTDLLAYSENHLLQAGFSTFKLNSSNNAINFYRSMGYCVNAQTTQSLEDGSEMICYEMQKTLATTA